jgi:hypothetical protein
MSEHDKGRYFEQKPPDYISLTQPDSTTTLGLPPPPSSGMTDIKALTGAGLTIEEIISKEVEKKMSMLEKHKQQQMVPYTIDSMPTSHQPIVQTQGSIPQYQHAGFIPQYQPPGFIPQHQLQDFMSYYQSRGPIPQYQPQGSVPQYTPQGSVPQYTPQGSVPQYTPQGSVPQYTPRSSVPRYGEPTYRGPPPTRTSIKDSTNYNYGDRCTINYKRDDRDMPRYGRYDKHDRKEERRSTVYTEYELIQKMSRLIISGVHFKLGFKNRNGQNLIMYNGSCVDKILYKFNIHPCEKTPTAYNNTCVHNSYYLVNINGVPKKHYGKYYFDKALVLAIKYFKKNNVLLKLETEKNRDSTSYRLYQIDV